MLQAQAHLTERDHQLLDWLYDHRLLTSFQIAHALFPSLDFTQKRLTKLVQLGVIARFRHQRQGGGSLPYHYLLDQVGYDVVTAQRGEEEPVRRNLARTRRQHLTSRANLPHLLGSNQFFIDLAGYARTHPGASLDRWWSTTQTIAPYAFTGPGEYFAFPGRPDGHGIFSQDGLQTAFWLEYDASTEPLQTLVDKVASYGRLSGGVGDQRTLTGALRRWPLLFDLGSWQRESHLHQQLARIPVRIPVATTSRDTNHARRLSPAESVWWLYHPTHPTAGNSTATAPGGIAAIGVPGQKSHQHRRLRLVDLPEAISAYALAAQPAAAPPPKPHAYSPEAPEQDWAEITEPDPEYGDDPEGGDDP